LNEKANNFRGVDFNYDKRVKSSSSEIREVWTVPIAAIGQLYQPRFGRDYKA